MSLYLLPLLSNSDNFLFTELYVDWCHMYQKKTADYHFSGSRGVSNPGKANSASLRYRGLFRGSPYRNHAPCRLTKPGSSRKDLREVMVLWYRPYLAAEFFLFAGVAFFCMFYVEFREGRMMNRIVGNMSFDHSASEGYMQLSLRATELFKASWTTHVW